MSETPFEAPAEESAPPTPPPPAHARPRSLMIVAALAAGLGVLGLIGVLFGCLGAVASLGMTTALTSTMPPEQAAAQTALMAASRPFVFVGIALFLAIIPLAVGLAVGGIQVLTDNPSGVGWLSNAFLFGLVVEPVRLVLQVVQTAVLWEETMAVTLAAASAQAQSTPTPPGMEETMGLIAMISVAFGVVVTLIWTIVKVALYAIGRRVLASEGTQDWILSKT